jgi:hypothetical protein
VEPPEDILYYHIGGLANEAKDHLTHVPGHSPRIPVGPILHSLSALILDGLRAAAPAEKLVLRPPQARHLTGAAILVPRGKEVLQAAPAA